MPTETPIWRDTYATVADALDLDITTIKRLVRIGEYPAVKIGGGKRPIVRLMPAEEYIRTRGKWSGVQTERPAE